MTWKILAATTLLAGSVLTSAWAQTAPIQVAPDNIIAGRQAAYDLQSAVAAEMKAAVGSGADVKQYADSAKAMAAWGRAIPGMFPNGTEAGHNTKALPAVWSDRPGFEKAAASFVANAEKLQAAAAADDKPAFAEAFKTTAESCGACHRTYRAK